MRNQKGPGVAPTGLADHAEDIEQAPLDQSMIPKSGYRFSEKIMLQQ